MEQIQIASQDEYENCNAQYKRQVIEIAILQATVDALKQACGVWETAHPENETPAA